MKKRIIAAMLAVMMTVSLAACGEKNKSAGKKESAPNAAEMTFEEIKKAAEGTTVTFYGWGGDEVLNKWLDDEFAPVMRTRLCRYEHPCMGRYVLRNRYPATKSRRNCSCGHYRHWM